jgi:hypothetical protein
MNKITLTDTWAQAVTGASVFVAQTNVRVELFVGSAPTAASRGFILPADVPHALPELSALGGEVWVRGQGEVIYATDA